MIRLVILICLLSCINSRAQITGTSEVFEFNIKPTKTKSEFKHDGGNGKYVAISKEYFFNIRKQIKEERQDDSFDSVAISEVFYFNIRKKERPVATPIVKKEVKSENDSQNRYHALIIAINDYQYNSQELHDLNQPIVDAESLKKVLTERYSFSNENINFLKNPTRSDILDKLDNLAYTLDDRDNLLIFFAGHGKWDEQINVGYWLPADARSDSKSNWISNSTLTDYIAGIKTKHTLLVSDACFSGSIFKSRSLSEGLSELGFAKIYKMPSRKAMTSGSLNIVPDKSVFMHYLLKRLVNFDEDFITSKQLFYQIETAVINNSNNIPQFGVIQNAGDEGGDFIFIRKK